jgi:hypothetical protein
MVLTVADVYSVRFSPKIPLPRVVQENIARLRILPVVYKPVRPVYQKNNVGFRRNPQPDNWRENHLHEAVRRVKERDDPEYSEVFTILNKLTTSNVNKLADDALACIQKRDDQFRLRVMALLFDKAIHQHGYGQVMSVFASKLNSVIPEVAEDLQTQVSMFPKLYNMTETIVFPSSTDEQFDDKVIQWSTQKDKRRGYAKFMIYLFLQKLIPEERVSMSLKQVLAELDECARMPKNPQMEENVTQFVEFMSESAKLLPKESVQIKNTIKLSLTKVLETPREGLPCLNMRSRFKIEDILKCVQ